MLSRSGSLFELGPGLLDAAFSSLGGFATSVYAARYLGSDALGAYALYFSAYTVASLVPQHLVFFPAQLASLSYPRLGRLSIIFSILLRGVIVSSAVAVPVSVSGLIVAHQVPAATLLALALTAAGAVVVSSLQDHVRASFHLAGESRCAAGIAAVYALATLTVIAGAMLTGIPPAWVPFGALVVANACSACFGLLLAANTDFPRIDLPPMRELLRTGKTLLPIAALTEGTTFVSGVIVALLASAAALGHAEAARTVMRPITVVGLGLDRQLAPRLMEAGQLRDATFAWRTARKYLAAIIACGLLLLLAGGIPGWGNPLQRLIPAAFDPRWLVAVVAVATTLSAISLMPRRILLGAGEHRSVLGIAAIVAATRLLIVAMVATSAGAYAMPLGVLGASALGGVLVVRRTQQLFASDRDLQLGQQGPLRAES
jgi:O-antigen/teichoic acid export membrane protein